MSISIRVGEAADVPALLGLRLAVHENRLSDPNKITHADFAPFLADGSLWVAKRDGVPLGFSALDVTSGVVWALFVDPAAEGQGVGNLLHRRLIEAAAAHSLPTLRLTTGKGTRAEHFYRARGWSISADLADGEVAMTLIPQPAASTP